MRLFISSLNSSVSVIPPIDYTNTVITANSDRWVIAIKDNYHLAVSSNLIELSDDNGATWSKSMSTSIANELLFGWIFENGNIALMQDGNIYKTDVTLNSISEIIVKDLDGVSDYDNSSTGRRHYINITIDDYNNTPDNTLVWGNYANSIDTPGGWTQISMYKTDDGIETAKAIKKFSVTDVLNDYPRHMHGIHYNKYDEKWLIITGDPISNYDVIWATVDKTTYNYTFLFTSLAMSPTIPEKFGATMFYFRQILGVTWVYWSMDNNVLTDAVRGIWRVKWTEMTDETKHERVLGDDFTLPYKVVDFRINETNGLLVAIVGVRNEFLSNTKLLIADDWGHGAWELKEFKVTHGITSFQRMSGFDSKGFCKIDTQVFDVLQGQTFLIKPGLDKFSNL